VGLIEVLNEKVVIQNDVMNETKISLVKKMANIEKNVI
jgi:predicted nucleic acid-binding protein